MDVRLTVNGDTQSVSVNGSESLLTTLRENLALPGSKPACEQGECGSCSVVMDGELICSCLVMIADCEGSTVRTVEGMAAEGALHPVQEAMLETGAAQCGFCTPGFVVAAAHLLEENPNPSADDIREELSGNICRCTGYGAILRALESLGGGTS